MSGFASPWNLQAYLLSSARAGLVIALQGLGIDRPRIAVPAYVCPSVVRALEYAGAETVFVDTEPQSLRFDQEALLASVTNRDVDAILAPNSYGICQAIATLQNYRLPVIEDAAYQSGRSDSASPAPFGLRGNIGVWSFNFKSLCSTGGGVLFVKHLDLSKLGHQRRTSRVLEFRKFFDYATRSAFGPYIPRAFPGAPPPGPDKPRNWKIGPWEAMTELQASIALAQWKRREDLYARQDANVHALSNVILQSPSARPLLEPGEFGPVHFFPILLPRAGNRAMSPVMQFRTVLYKDGVQTETPYPIFANRSSAPNAVDLASRIVLIPCGASHYGKAMHIITSAVKRALLSVEKQFRER